MKLEDVNIYYFECNDSNDDENQVKTIAIIAANEEEAEGKLNKYYEHEYYYLDKIDYIDGAIL